MLHSVGQASTTLQTPTRRMQKKGPESAVALIETERRIGKFDPQGPRSTTSGKDRRRVLLVMEPEDEQVTLYLPGPRKILSCTRQTDWPIGERTHSALRQFRSRAGYSWGGNRSPYCVEHQASQRA